MSNNCNDIAKILLTDGTNQGQRTINELDPETLKIHGFGVEEWLKFAHNMAGHLNYYSPDSASTPVGDWKDFLVEENAIDDLIASLGEAKDLTPHLTLFMCFLKLLELPNDNLNRLTKRHLDYYYQEVLQVEKLPATYDKVHLLLELSKNFSSHLFEEGLEFNGGKDGNGKLRIYKLIEEFAANKATVSSLRNVYIAPDDATRSDFPYVKAATQVNSLDGLGEALTEEETSWFPFGYDKGDQGINSSNFLELPNAKMGFAVASETLRMAEGERHVQFTFEFDNAVTEINGDDLVEAISVYSTTEKKWFRISEESQEITEDLQKPFDPLAPIEFVEETELEGDRIDETDDFGFYTGIDKDDSSKVRMYSIIDIDAPSVTGYDQEIHLENFGTSSPVFRFLVDTSSEKGFEIFKQFRKNLLKVTVEIVVTQIRNLKLENDLGVLNPSKPMYPFSNTPIAGSNFTVTSEEILTKNWQDIDLFITWKNVPGELKNHYENYGVFFRNRIEPRLIVGGRRGGRIRRIRRRQYGNIFPPMANVIDTSVLTDQDYMDNHRYHHFWAKRGVFVNGEWINSLQGSLFTSRANEDDVVTYETEAQFRRGSLEKTDNIEKIRIQLFDSFYHDEYPQLYTLAVLQDPTSQDDLPNKPYTPFAEDIQVTYSAIDELDLSSKSKVYEDTDTKLFHEHPFGQSEEHTSIKKALGFIDTEDQYSSLMPRYDYGGELYIGLENALPLQTIPLLFQISEGTENTQIASFTGDEGIEFEVLCSNHWKAIDKSDILVNEVDNFLKTGIVSMTVPKEMTDDNTLLPAGQQWIRAKMKDKRYDTVCKFIGVHSQVALAQFSDNGNETSHLTTGLEAETIAKLIQRSSSVKSIMQPYNSFGGKQEELDSTYYRRVSERLRHKNRAVTMWDYENLVLQNFPDVYRVKCLSHSSLKSFNAGGSVIMIVIPDTVNKNVFDIYQPRVSTAYLNEIHDFLAKHSSMHVCLKVMNPNYEAIKIITAVRFNSGYDELLYQSILEEDITKLLAPWAYDETKEVQFGGKLHKSMLINYIENLEYIDYIQSIKIKVQKSVNNAIVEDEVPNYKATSPLTIMVSAREHKISVADKPCPEETELLTSVDCD